MLLQGPSFLLVSIRQISAGVCFFREIETVMIFLGEFEMLVSGMFFSFVLPREKLRCPLKMGPGLKRKGSSSNHH